MPARLVITDGTVEINLLDRSFGFHLSSWEPAIARYKQGGTFSDSPLADGRRLVDSHFENVFETFELKANSLSQDSLIRDTQELRRLLEKGASYWTANWQNEPVWIEARASRETNLRYSLVVAGSIANDDDPFQMPFLQPDCTAVMDELDLVVEREPFWRGDVPGEGPCVEITGSQVYEEGPPWILEYNATTSEVVVTDIAAIQNLPTVGVSPQFTVDGWLRADGWGENNEGFIMSKAGWEVYISTANGIEAIAKYGGTDALSLGVVRSFSPDGEWHHLAFTYNGQIANIWRIWLDGVEITYKGQQQGVGVYAGDIGNDLYIGNQAANNRTWDGGIGWMRLTDGLLYTVDFTPPAQCQLPTITVNTIGQWIGAEYAGATIDNQEGTVALDGTQTNCVFDSCPPEYGRAVETCLDETYVGNKHNIANITNVHYFDSVAGAWSINLAAAAPPFEFLQNPVAAGDVVVFGIDTTLVDSGPFASLVFDIGTAMANVTTAAWKYSTVGADPTVNWLALAVQDYTNQGGAMTGQIFDTTGVGSVHWAQPSGWTVQNPTVAAVPLGITGYWVCVHITVVGAATPPTQQLRDIYSIVWPHVEADELQIAGDVPSLLQFNYKNRSDRDGGAGFSPNAWANRVIAGIRSNARGTGFTPFINCAQEQNPLGIAVTTVGAGQIFQVDPTAPAGWHIQTTNPASTEGFLVRFTQPALDQYRGTYRVFMRGDITAGGVGDQRFRLMIREPIYWEGEFRQFETTDDWSYIDFGEFTFPPTYPGQDPDEQMAYVDLTIEAEVFFAGFTCRFYDLIMFPVDEWTGDFIRSAPAIAKNSASSIAGPGLDAGPFTDIGPLFLNVDSVGFPKMSIKAYTETDSYVWSRYLSISPGPAILQANADQRLFFLAFRYDDTGRVWTSEPWISASLQLTHVDRYLSMRGDR